MNTNFNKANATVLIAALIQIGKSVYPDGSAPLWDAVSAVLLWLAVYFIPNKEGQA